VANLWGVYRSPFHESPPAEFVDQFEWDGGDWLYRYKETGPAYRVTDTEKDALVAAFGRWQKWAGLAVVLILVGMVFLLAKLDALPPGFGIFGIVVGTMVRNAIDWTGYRRPLRAFEGRVAVAPAWSKAARAQLALDRASPTELVGTSFAAAGFFALFGLFGWPFDLTGVFLLISCAWMVARAIIHVVRERQARTAEPHHAAIIRT